MLTKRLSGILCLVLSNVLFTNGFPNNSTDSVSRSEQQCEPQPRFNFLGVFNGRNWYIERTHVTYAEAVTGCASMGFQLPRVNQDELSYLYTVTTPEDNLAWLGATAQMTLSTFRWRSDNTVPSGIIYNNDIYLNYGLALERFSDEVAGVRTVSTESGHFYICST